LGSEKFSEFFTIELLSIGPSFLRFAEGKRKNQKLTEKVIIIIFFLSKFKILSPKADLKVPSNIKNHE